MIYKAPTSIKNQGAHTHINLQTFKESIPYHTLHTDTHTHTDTKQLDYFVPYLYWRCVLLCHLGQCWIVRKLVKWRGLLSDVVSDRARSRLRLAGCWWWGDPDDYRQRVFVWSAVHVETQSDCRLSVAPSRRQTSRRVTSSRGIWHLQICARVIRGPPTR